jgi:hypothetical protein
VTGRLYVKLAPEAFAALVQRAQDERRHPSAQAAVLLERAMRRQNRQHPPMSTAISERGGTDAA